MIACAVGIASTSPASAEPSAPRCAVVCEPAAAPPRNQVRRRTAIVLGATGLAAVVAIPFVANDVQNDYLARGRSPDPPTTTMTLLGVGWVAGLALTGVAAYLWIHEPRTTVAPIVTRDSVGIALGRRF
jgi:hypothetical protein